MTQRLIWVTIITSLVLIAFLLFITRHLPSRPDDVRDINALQVMFPVLEQYRVEDFRNQTWCKNINHVRGKFSNNNRQATCNLFEGVAADFDAQASEDFQLIASRLAASGVRVMFMHTKFDSFGKLNWASFELSAQCWNCNRRRYIYAPNFGDTYQDIPNEVWVTKINEDWVFEEEDRN